MEFTDITFSPVDFAGYEDPDSSTEKHREHPPTVWNKPGLPPLAASFG